MKLNKMTYIYYISNFHISTDYQLFKITKIKRNYCHEQIYTAPAIIKNTIISPVP